MDAQQYEKIRKNLSLLHDNVDVMQIFPRLCETGTLDHDHKKELESVTTDRGRIDRLIQILKLLPPDKRAYDSFLDALRKSGLPDYEEYAKAIEETSVVADASVISQVDPSHFEDKVSQVLSKNFANLDKQETSINEVRQVLVDSKVFTHTTWSNKELARFICDSAFVGVEKIKKKTSPSSNTLFFKHLGRIQPCSQAGANPGKSTSHTQDEDIASDIQTLSASELKAFLLKKFEVESLPTTPLNELEAENISGKYFVTLNEEDMKSVMPSATFVHRRFLRLLIDEHRKLKEAKELIKVIPFQKFRTFDKEIRATDRYIFGRLVDTKINSRGKKTTPLRNFHLPEFDMESDVESFVLKECAKFAAACINDRQNGTVYFGISPDDTRGRRPGEIVGIQLSHGNLDSNIPAMFYAHRQSLIKSCVRNLKVVPVVGNENEKQLFVLELDVNPGMAVKEVESVRLDASGMHCLMKECKVSDPIFSFSESGKPRQMYPKDTGGRTEIAPSVSEQRKIEETKTASRGRPNLIHLRNHLTGGLDKLDDDLYVFLLLSPFCESNVDVNNMEFIKHLQPSVLFDFDTNSEVSNSIYRSMEEKEEVVRVVTLNDFDERQRDKKEIKAFQNDLVDCEFANWVFCNGYGQMEKMEAIDWNKKRSHAFQTAFSHYVERFQQDRILIIICLFSPQYKVMLDPCNEILSRFPDQWILLSETQSIADTWQGTFQQREKVDTKDLRERCIIGLSWEQVNTGITDWCGKKDSNECKIPESSGCLIKVENKKIKEWTDVEVLSALNPIDNTNDDEESTTALIKASEEEFYRGGQVSWLNFFSDHVCRRKIHQPLQKLVEDALEGTSNDDDERILTTYLFHEPGAGGSTSARHILWCLRQKYRCCVVREINNPSQTADQLTEIFLHRDKSPKPLLVLLDNEDEDKVFQLRVHLEKKARECDEQISDVFCVLLICSRMFDVPIPKRNSSMEVLKQSLEKEDRIWFEQRYKDLTKRYENPKSLISFNILKENFNKDYIKNTVKEFLDEIKDARELTILKIVSFINNYDLDFKPIHASCFDSILDARPVHRSNHNGTRKARWEANVSQSFKVLLNMSSKDVAKKIRLFTKHTAQHILNCLREKSGESVSDILSSLLTDKIFSATDQGMEKFQNIISNLVKKRALKGFGFRKGQSPSLFRKEKFSPLILDIKENENSDIAGQMMEHLFELNSDPYTAQQVARFYIECKNYKKAEKYAKEATALLPWNSYMWDTYAQVFKDQLHDKFQSKCQIVDGEFSEEDLKEIIYICQTCTQLFRKEQSVSQKEAISGNAEINRAGYFDELRSILIMLSSIEKCSCFESKEIVHKFLVDRVYTNERLHFLSQDEMNYLKSLWNYSKDTVRKLGDEFLQTKVEIEANPLSSSHDESRKTLLRLHVSLNEYFGESSDLVPTYLHENDKNHYRYRVVFSKNCHTLDKCLELKQSKDFDVLTECYHLILENVKSVDSTVDDIKILLDIVTVLVTEAGRNAIVRFKFQDIIQWSKDLYQRATREDYRRLETFLYFTLYNFPTDERLNCPSLASPQDLAKVLKNWKEFFNASKNLQRITHRETTLFFLGKGKPPHDIVYQKYLDKLMYGTDNKEKWQSSEVCKHLRLMSGILTEKGDHIDYPYKSKQGNQHWIRVKTTNRVKNKAWLQKKVYFYLGFSFSGLKAYGMSDTNPETRDPPTKAPNLTRNRHFSPGAAKSKQHVMSLRELEQRKWKLTSDIKERKANSKPCDDLKRDLEEVNNGIQEILGN